MAYLYGNDYGTKLKDPKVRQEAYKQYCEHIASGYPKEAFVFDHPVHSVTWETMDKYIKENPDEFPPHKMQKARSQRYKHWMNRGIALMEGKYRNGSPVVWQTIMRNIFRKEGWDQKEFFHSESLEQVANQQAIILKQIESKQEAIKTDQEAVRTDSHSEDTDSQDA